MTSLDLSNNQLYRKSCAELTQIFQAIPASITSFQLADNKFSEQDKFTEEQIRTVFTVLRTRQDVHLDFGDIKLNTTVTFQLKIKKE